MNYLNLYLMLNGAIAVGYIISRLILVNSFFINNNTQAQRLKFARFSLIASIALFLCIPKLLSWMPYSYHSTFVFEPVFGQKATGFIPDTIGVASDITSLSMLPSIEFILIGIFLIMVCFHLFGYLRGVMALSKLREKSFCLHKIKNIYILFNTDVKIPFCWSFVRKHYVVIPSSFLSKPEDLKIALRHELQHIRQNDSYWLHFIRLFKIIGFWNPFMGLWKNWLNELQEFSCDEALVLRHGMNPEIYAQCLINTASSSFRNEILLEVGVSMCGLSKSILARRINMLFNYKVLRNKKCSMIFACLALVFSLSSAAYALSPASGARPLTAQEVASLIKKSNLDQSFQIEATPEVVNEINNIRASKQARSFMRESLERMKKYQLVITAALDKKSMPSELLAIPLVESGYQPLNQSKNSVLAAGIWQIIPTTARNYGLVVDKERDDRMNTYLATNAALNYLNALYKQFNNWKLAVMAYEYGEDLIQNRVKENGSTDVKNLAHSANAPKNMKKFNAMFDASVIIIHNPALVS